MKRSAIVTAAAAILFYAGCDLSFILQFEQGSGVSATEEREVQEFEKIEFAGSGDISVVCGKEPSLTITTDDNLLEFYETVVEGKTLTIRTTANLSPAIRPTLEITTDKLVEFGLAGSGNIDVQDVDSESLKFEIAGSGKIYAVGVAEKLKLEIAGSGSANLEELVARQVEIDIAGSGKGTVNAVESLDVEIAGSGNISYIGSPEVNKSIAGSGKVKPIQTKAEVE